MNQQEMISDFIDKSRLKMNPELFDRSDEDVMQQLMDAIKSCERVGLHFSIEVAGFTVIDDFDEINERLFNYYEVSYRNKTKAKRKDNRYGFINLNESDIRLLIVHYKISDKEVQSTLDVMVAVPRIIDKFYFKIDGIMRSTLYQIVDGSTYNNSTSASKVPSVTLKLVFMAVRLYRSFVAMTTTKGEQLKASYYTSHIFSKTVSAVKYSMAKYGLFGSMNFYGINGILLTQFDPNDNFMYTFQKSEHLFVNVPKILFDRDLVTQTFVVTIFNSIYEGIPFNEYFNDTYWIRNIGAEFNKMAEDKFIEIFNEADESKITDTYDKGIGILDSFETIFDICTKNALRLPEEDKHDMHCVLRWMLREFNNLRMKDNLDISVKRIRFSEYVASLYAMKIAKGIYRVADMNKRATVESIVRAIRTDPMFLLKAITQSKMISYRNMVSDMDSMQALKFTYKGVSGLGESGKKSIPDIYRSIQPSHIGRVDLDSSSDGNPGITGTLNPFMGMKNGYFSDYQEPDFWTNEYNETLKDYSDNRKLKQAFEFQEQLLSVDHSEDKEMLDDIACHMQQIINPIIYQVQNGMIFDDHVEE